MRGSTDPQSVITRLAAATNAHDLDALTACFADDYVNVTPVHPAQSFSGSAQVARNWAALFGAIPDLRADLLATAVDGSTVWSEWEMSGTRPDRTQHLMRGVIVFVVEADAIASARFYLEPVTASGPDIDGAIARATHGAVQDARP
ncbi:nuclear transport factor 2 family protein [Diaminobutyricibacter tongyongensis]|uniref:Nuclear transport factor 2 family protein n=1 Tax=Leifsonia tongyongensis TaxID=1268043 RepID=A0A6L9XXK4_9MICO|nr:nuclear transport factor 2 family protein [Diaminobutyricibacter tongyongensis]NEN05947.1 nuclear transport factor 2 family protein [Diaminobutyricibacter tongyongensis]